MKIGEEGDVHLLHREGEGGLELLIVRRRRSWRWSQAMTPCGVLQQRRCDGNRRRATDNSALAMFVAGRMDPSIW